MRKTWMALAMLVLAAGTAIASDTSEVMAPVHQFVDGFNKGDVKTAMAACVDTTSIIDEFAPYQWTGASACTAWLNDYESDARKNGITDGIVTLATPRHVDTSGDHAYVVVPANYTFKQNGKSIKETGSTFIFALQKGTSGWHIVGWSWGKH